MYEQLTLEPIRHANERHDRENGKGEQYALLSVVFLSTLGLWATSWGLLHGWV